MIFSVICTLLLLPMMVFSLGPKINIRNVYSVRSVLNQGLITCENCPVVSLNTTDNAINTVFVVGGKVANTFSIQESTTKYYMAPGQNDQYIVEWSLSPFYWFFTVINNNIYTISDVATSSQEAKCWITSSGSSAEYGYVNYDTCPGTIPSAWVVTDVN